MIIYTTSGIRNTEPQVTKKKRFYTSIASELNYRIRGKILQFLFFFLSRWVLERGILYDARMHGFSLSLVSTKGSFEDSFTT